MLITILYGVVLGLIFYLIQKLIRKKFEIKNFRFQTIVSIINILLVTLFTSLYLINPELFSTQYVIQNNIIYYCFSLVALYYYILALPLTISNIIVLVTNRIFNLLFYVNILVCILLAISFQLFL